MESAHCLQKTPGEPQHQSVEGDTAPEARAPNTHHPQSSRLRTFLPPLGATALPAPMSQARGRKGALLIAVFTYSLSVGLA